MTWGLVALVQASAPGPLHADADDDWSLSRERAAEAGPRARPGSRAPRDPAQERVLAYRRALARPEDTLAVEQLCALEQAAHGSLDQLAARLAAERDRAPRDARPPMLLARVLASAHQPDQALAELVRAEQLSSDPSDPKKALPVRLGLLRELGRHAEAATLREQLGRAPGSAMQRAAHLREAGRAWLDAGEAEQALRALASARALGGAAMRLELAALELEAARRTGRVPLLIEQLEREGRWLEAARAWQEQGQLARSVTAYRRALGRTSAKTAGVELVGVLTKHGQLADAEVEAVSLQRRAPSDPDVLVLLAELRRSAGRREQALALLAERSRRAPGAAPLHRALHALYVRWNEAGLAAHELSVLARLAPHDRAVLTLRADAALARGERAAALELLQSTVVGGSGADEAALAAALADRDLLPEALEHAERALALAPRVLSHRRALASLLERAGRLREAEQSWRALLEAGPDSSLRREARRHLVGLYSREGTLALQLADLRARESAGSLSGEQTLLLAELYGREPSGPREQRELLTRRLVEAPGDVDAWLLLAQVQQGQADYSAALTSWRAILGLASEDRAQHARAALELAQRCASEPAAQPVVAQAVALAASDPQVARLEGDFYRARGDAERARAGYQRALRLDPGNAEAGAALAQDALAGGEVVRAEALWRDIIRSARDERAVAAAARALLERNQARGESALLDALGASAGAPLPRRLLLEHYAATLLPRSATSCAERHRKACSDLEPAVLRALPALLLALAAGTPSERAVALRILEAAPVESARGTLQALAAQTEEPLQDRAHAVIALGRLPTEGGVPGLRDLLQVGPPQLAPAVLWALSQSPGSAARATLLSQLSEPRRERRALVVLLLAADTSDVVRTRLRELANDADSLVAFAARWALAQQSATSTTAGAALQSVRGEDQAGSRAERALALASSDESAALAQALLGPDSADRELASALVVAERTEAGPLPAPSWPFALEDYVVHVVRVGRVGSAARQHDRLADALLATALAQLDAAREVAARTLRLLVPYGEGVLPQTLATGPGCPPAGLAHELASGLDARLLELAREGEPAASWRALELLARGGAGGRPEGRAGLARLLASDRWPTRMWALRALGRASPVLAGEPVALVRAAAHSGLAPSSPSGERCDPGRRATN